MNFIKWIRYELGLYKNTDYEKQYLYETNFKTAIYMTFIIICLEIWMIIRYINKRPGRTFLEYFDGETNYLILLSASLIILLFATRYLHDYKRFITGILTSLIILALDISMIVRACFVTSPKDILHFLKSINYQLMLLVLTLGYLIYEILYKNFSKKLSAKYGQILSVIFSVICLSFGVSTSIYDIKNERQILCFVTMVLYVVCLLIWKPFISILITTTVFIWFYEKWLSILQSNTSPYSKNILEGNKINYFTLWISLTLISMSIYQQRLAEAKKDEKLMRVNALLKQQSIEDDLTGISNIKHFVKESKKVMFKYATDLIYLFINIENFKNYNDQFGYQSGNNFLIYIAHSLEEIFPDGIVARWSDDHFVVLTKRTGLDERLNKLNDKVSSSSNREIYLALKVGAYTPLDTLMDPRMAVDKARFACGLIKDVIGVHFKEYDEQVNNEFHRHQYIVNNIDKAIENEYIKVYYQPVVWSSDHTLCSCEALARWIDLEYGFLSPGDFIPLLEEYKQIHKLDKYIWETVCKDMAYAKSLGLKPIPVSLNFSRLDFELINVEETLMSLTEKYKIPKKNIHVEITESALAENTTAIQSSADALAKAGFVIWLDDFGSGYSSLNVLKDFSLDLIKIDMKFLSGFENNDKSKIILKNIVALAKNLNMHTITEGVETKEEATFLHEIGCDRLQGYFFGKPMPINDIIKNIQLQKLVIRKLS